MPGLEESREPNLAGNVYLVRRTETTRETKTMKTTKKQREQARAVVVAMAGLPRINPQAIADIVLAYDLWGWPTGSGMSAREMPNKAARRRLAEGIGRAAMADLDARLKEARLKKVG